MANTELPWIISKYCSTNDLVLDAGCGGFLYSELLIYSGARIVSIDLKNYNYTKSKKYNFIAGSIEYLPFSDNSFDLIVCLSVLQYFHDSSNYPSILLEFERVLKPNGIIILSVPNALSMFRIIRDLEVKFGCYKFSQYNLPHHYYTKKNLSTSTSSNLTLIAITGYIYNFLPRLIRFIIDLSRINNIFYRYNQTSPKITTQSQERAIEIPEKMPFSLMIGQKLPIITNMSYHHIAVFKKIL